MLTLLKILFSPLFFFMQWLAEENILFTTVREGTVKAIMRGKSLDHFIMSFAGYHLNDPRQENPKNKRYLKKFIDTVKDEETGIESPVEKIVPKWEVLYHGHSGKGKNKYGFESEEQQSDDYYDDRHWLLKELGLHWVGWPWVHSVYVYPFEWNETKTDTDTGKERVFPRAEATDFIYAADFTYAITTDGAETKDRLPTDELTLVTVAIRNPYRALFSGEDWMQRITAAINRLVKNFVGSKGYDELISISKEEEGTAETSKQWAKEFSGPIIALTEYLPDETHESPHPRGLHERYGVVIRTGDLQTVTLAGTPEAQRKLQEASTMLYAAEQEAKATIAKGEATSRVIELTGEKESLSLRKRLEVIKEFGEDGRLLAQLDGIQESSKGPGNTIIWANNPFVALAESLQSKTKGADKS
jgi:hypothetical protein